MLDMKKGQVIAGLKGRDEFINHFWSNIAPHTLREYGLYDKAGFCVE